MPNKLGKSENFKSILLKQLPITFVLERRASMLYPGQFSYLILFGSYISKVINQLQTTTEASKADTLR